MVDAVHPFRVYLAGQVIHHSGHPLVKGYPVVKSATLHHVPTLD